MEVDSSVGCSTLLVHGRRVGTGLSQVAEGLAVAVTVSVAAADAVATAKCALDSSVVESLVRSNLSEGHREN